MSPQKINNLTALDELTALPGEAPFNKNKAWQKLEGRLQDRPKRSKAIWYRAAAAMIIGISSSPFFFPAKKQPAVIVKAAAIPEQKIISPLLLSPHVKKETVAFAATAPQKENKAVPVPGKFSFAKTNFPKKISIPDSLSVTVIPAQQQVLPAVAVPEPVVTVPSKAFPKKLNVVHNNELEDEDRIASQNSNNIKAIRKHPERRAAMEYAGGINFRIHLKN